MIERPLMTPDELKAIPKGEFVVMKTGSRPMKVQLKLFTKWGISFEEPFSMPEKAGRAVAYGNKDELLLAILNHYPQNAIPTESPTGMPETKPTLRTQRKENDL